jgi:hypothetical protein
MMRLLKVWPPELKVWPPEVLLRDLTTEHLEVVGDLCKPLVIIFLGY